MKRGKFITVEGGEGAGKSTNLDYLQRLLQDAGKTLVRTREPGGTLLGEEIRQLLLKHRDEGMDETAELLLMFGARAEHLTKLILPALERGDWVLCDRFTDSTYAYQGTGRGLNIDIIRQLEGIVQHGIKPDLSLLLDLPVETGMERAGQRSDADRFEQENLDFFDKVRAGYLRLEQSEPDRIKRIDASLALPEVQKQIARVVKAFIEQS